MSTTTESRVSMAIFDLNGVISSTSAELILYGYPAPVPDADISCFAESSTSLYFMPPNERAAKNTTAPTASRVNITIIIVSRFEFFAFFLPFCVGLSAFFFAKSTLMSFFALFFFLPFFSANLPHPRFFSLCRYRKPAQGRVRRRAQSPPLCLC